VSALLLCVVSILPAAAQAAAPEYVGAARNQQWVYRDTLGSGTVRPTAIFLSRDYSAVVFAITCDRSSGELVVRYILQPEAVIPESFSLRVMSATTSVPLQTVLVGGMLESRSTVSREFREVLRSEGALEIDAPNELGEPWGIGRAEPLRKLALGCR
jgi:hypothetical protein